MPVPVRILRHSALHLAALASMLLLSACAQESAPGPETASVGDGPSHQQDVVATPPPAGTHVDSTTAAGATAGGDGSAIQLDPLADRDLAQAGLTGELSCVFLHESGALLHAAGNVASDDPALGAVKVAGVVEHVRAPGGFDGILDGPDFTGRGLTIRIHVTGPAIGGGESPPRPANLTYLRADGASRNFDGHWQCGP
ncbi:hypothetical protein [Luteimonas sp. SDU101]|uniref:hypothetical protein n=1 Tax=unclassified Luteimonas TaxID=2629088 RepID=UPI003EB83224